MQLNIFEFVESTANLLSEKSAELKKIEEELDTFSQKLSLQKTTLLTLKHV